MALHLTDVEATQARKFKNKRSRVLKDGREILYGKDWEARKRELWERCGGQCECRVTRTANSLGDTFSFRCGKGAVDPHHIIPRSKGRDDRLENLGGVCRQHHRELDKRKIGGCK